MAMVALTLLAVALALLYRYLSSTFTYWRDQGVPFIKPYPLFGSMGRLLMGQEAIGDFFMRIYKQYPTTPFVGFFQVRTPAIVVRDPELIKNVMIKDFQHFGDHGFGFTEDGASLQARNLFNMNGQRWKEMRAKLSPTFTTGKIKAMFPLVYECSERLEKYLEALANTNKDLDIKDLLARYTTDVIASCAFGVECDSISDPSNMFREMGRRVFDVSFIQGLKNGLTFFVPELARRLKFNSIHEDVNTFFRKMVSDVIAMRVKSGVTRNDFMQLLIQLREKGKLSLDAEYQHELELQEHVTDTKFTDEDVAAQAFVFFVGGFETSSSTLTYGLYELARKPELQKKAREHIEEVLARHGGKLSYQALHEMTYLDWILQESLRKYPVLPILNRVCTKNYTIPGTQVTLEAGNFLVIPIHALHNDPEHFPDPEMFIPERFSDQQLLQKNQYIYLPFGDGPRQCIGMRFARMQSKLGLLAILRKMEVRPSALNSYPLSWDPKQLIMTSNDTVYIKLVRA